MEDPIDYISLLSPRTYNATVIQIIYHLATYFKGDYEKVSLWIKAKNPLLGNISAIDMISTGREKKLLKFIEDCLSGNHP